MSDTIHAPFSEGQIAELERSQKAAFHPYTCKEHSDTPLVPTTSGWVCGQEGCSYTQTWAHAAHAKTSEGELFLVVYQDSNGCRHIVGGENDFNSHAEAQGRIDGILAGQRKEHKVSYEIFPYARGAKEAIMLEHRITG